MKNKTELRYIFVCFRRSIRIRFECIEVYFRLVKAVSLQPLLKDPSQPPPFSMPSKLLILHGEAKSYCLAVSCVSESMFHYL